MNQCVTASALAVLLTVGGCQGQRPPSDERPTADTQATAPDVGEATTQPVDSGPEVATTPTTPPDTGRAAPTGQDTAFAGTVDPIRRARSAPPVAILREVRSAAHAGYDRVVFEFGNGMLPGYHIEYAAGSVYQCGSGDEVSVAGAAKLIVRLEPARAHDERGNVTIEERQRVLTLPAMKELLIVCDFEAQVEWVVGLAGRTPYRVAELGEPPRLVVDVQHRP